MAEMPVVLVFGIATTIDSIHRSLPHRVTSLLSMEKFQAPSSSDYLSMVLDQVSNSILRLWSWDNNRNNPFNGPLSQETPGELVPEKNIHSLTPYLSGYFTLSLINFLHLEQSLASIILQPTS